MTNDGASPTGELSRPDDRDEPGPGGGRHERDGAPASAPVPVQAAERAPATEPAPAAEQTREQAPVAEPAPASAAKSDVPEAATHSVITLRPLASPLPLGLFAFGIGNLLVAVAHLGGFSGPDVRVSMVILATFVALPQGAASVLAFLAREPVAATLFGLLAVTWVTDLVVQEYTGATTSAARGVLFLAVAVVMVLLALPGLNAKPLLSLVVLTASARFAAGGLYDITASTAWQRTSGGLAVAVAVLAGYLAAALVFEDVRHRTVLPVWRRGESRTAMESGLAEQERPLPQEAGVRAQL